MASKRVKICDVCGNEIPRRHIWRFKDDKPYRYKIIGHIFDGCDGERTQKIDMCEDCFREMKKILNKRRIEQVQEYLKPYGY